MANTTASRCANQTKLTSTSDLQFKHLQYFIIHIALEFSKISFALPFFFSRMMPFGEYKMFYRKFNFICLINAHLISFNNLIGSPVH